MPNGRAQIAVALRPCSPADREFLVGLYRSVRDEELSVVGWSDAERDAFVRMQFDLQDRGHAARFANVERSIIALGSRRIGRLYVHRDESEIRIVDIAILPEFRCRGVGTGLIGDVVGEGERAGLPVRLHVEPLNPAKRLYERLGFVPVSADGVYEEMERRP